MINVDEYANFQETCLQLACYWGGGGAHVQNPYDVCIIMTRRIWLYYPHWLGKKNPPTCADTPVSALFWQLSTSESDSKKKQLAKKVKNDTDI